MGIRKMLLLINILGVFTLCNCNKEVDPEDRFNSEIFENIIIDNDIVYGSNITQGGREINLLMDIYQPVNDTLEVRPLVILAHGGKFLVGNKSEFSELAALLAKSGYVATSISYRLLDITPSSENLKKSIIDALFDMKSAVRYFYKHYEEYKIDTTNIFIGGYSAGSFTAMHYAYVNENEEILTFGGNEILEYINSCGGLEGNSGNSGFSTKVKGVINISGALITTDFINSGEPMIFSVHGTADNIVPYLEGESAESGVITQGSGLIHPVASEKGIPNSLKTINGGDHAVFFNCKKCPEELRGFIFDNL